MTTSLLDRFVIARDDNVIRVDFRRYPEPPAPTFPGAAALRDGAFGIFNIFIFKTNTVKAEVA